MSKRALSNVGEKGTRPPNLHRAQLARPISPPGTPPELSELSFERQLFSAFPSQTFPPFFIHSSFVRAKTSD